MSIRDRNEDERAPRPIATDRWSDRLIDLTRSLPHDLDTVLERLPAMAVVLDPRGRIVGHNAQWAQAADAHGLDPHTVGLGVDYLAACDQAGEAGVDQAADAAAGIRSVLRSEAREFSMDYECSGPDDRRWYTLRVSQLTGPGSGALVTHVDISSVRGAELAIRGHIHDLWHVVDPDYDFILLVDDEATVLARTPDRSRPVAWPEVGDFVFDCVHPEDRRRLSQELDSILAATGTRGSVAFRAKGPDGVSWGHYTAKVVNLLHDPTVEGVVVAVVDVTDEVRASATAALAATMSSELPVAAIAADASGIVTSANEAAAQMLGVSADVLVGQPLRRHVVPLTSEQVEEMRAARADDRDWSGDIHVRRPDGAVVPFSVFVRHAVDPVTGFDSYLYLGLDHSEEHRLRESLVVTAQRDSLTGLLNRPSFLREVAELADRLPPGETGAVAKISLDRFREVNELHGSPVGDAVLRAVGEALVECAGEGAAVGRFDGDVFAVAVGPERVSPTFGAELLAAIEVVASGNRHLTLRLCASVGVRLLSADDDDPGTVMDDALLAVREAKATGGDTTRCFDEALRAELRQRTLLRKQLANAITAGELTVLYQPIVRMADGGVVGAEALVRWNHPTEGLLAPDRFIPLAEQTLLVHDIGAFVLEDACAKAARWRDLRPETRFSVSVNLSPAQLDDAHLVARVEAALQRHHLDPGLLTLELTESMVMERSGHGHEQLARLRALGVRIAIDDFGTGYSSLARLKELPVDVVKIDRSFVTGVASSPQDLLIVRTVVGLAEAVGLDVVAEGVEDVLDGRQLQRIGCTVAQGFLWSRPVPPEDLDRMRSGGVRALPTSVAPNDSAPGDVDFAEGLRTFRHELATPLAVLNMSMAARGPEGSLPGDVVDTVERMVRRVSRLVDSLDLLEHIDRGTLRPDRSAHDVGVLVRQVVADLAGKGDRSIDLEITGQATAEVDAPLVELVVANLLTNAEKYSPPSVPVSVVVDGRGDEVRVEVHDRGPGIPAERLGTVWRKFGRLDHQVPGSGIGLFLARGIARAHGGDLRYRARPGGGSTFVLDLPAR